MPGGGGVKFGGDCGGGVSVKLLGESISGCWRLYSVKAALRIRRLYSQPRRSKLLVVGPSGENKGSEWELIPSRQTRAPIRMARSSLVRAWFRYGTPAGPIRANM